MMTPPLGPEGNSKKDIQVKIAVNLNMGGFHWQISDAFEGWRMEGPNEASQGPKSQMSGSVSRRTVFNTEGTKKKKDKDIH